MLLVFVEKLKTSLSLVSIGPCSIFVKRNPYDNITLTRFFVVVVVVVYIRPTTGTTCIHLTITQFQCSVEFRVGCTVWMVSHYVYHSVGEHEQWTIHLTDSYKLDTI
jgi:hypothetical protein